MSNRQRLSVQQVLNILQDLPSDQSDIEVDGETDVQFDYTVDDVDSDDTYHVDSESNNDSSEVESSSENISDEEQAAAATSSNVVARGRGKGRGRGRGSVRPGAEQAMSDVAGHEYIGRDGTVWQVINPGDVGSGRRGQHNILCEVSGPTGHAKRDISQDKYASPWRLLINEAIIRQIKRCTELEALRVLNDDTWSTSLIGILYARGARGLNMHPVDSLWSEKWGPPFFAHIVLCRTGC